jgi:hypothetical protein
MGLSLDQIWFISVSGKISNGKRKMVLFSEWIYYIEGRIQSPKHRIVELDIILARSLIDEGYFAKNDQGAGHLEPPRDSRKRNSATCRIILQPTNPNPCPEGHQAKSTRDTPRTPSNPSPTTKPLHNIPVSDPVIHTPITVH